MGDNINIDWRNLEPAPDISNSFMTAFNAGHQMAIQRQADTARNAVLADPSDQNALTKLSMFDPQSAQAVYANQDRARAVVARQAAGQVVAAYAMPGQQTNAFAPPQPAMAPQAPPQPLAAPQQPGTGAAPSGQPQAPQMAPQPGATPAMGAQPGAQQQSSPMTDPTHPVTQAIGVAAAQGQANPQQAWATLYSADPAMGDQMVKAVQGIDGLRLSRLAEANNALGSEAQALLAVPQQGRAAELQRIAPQLLAHGVTAQQLQGAMQEGLSDNFLHGVVGQAIGTAGLLEETHKNASDSIADRNATNTENVQSETVRHNKADENQGVVVTNPLGGSSLVRRSDGSIIYNSDGGSGTGNSLGERNNNAGNIRDGKFAQSQPGYAGAGEGGFAKFATPQAGIAAQESLLRNNYGIGQGATVNSIINKYAPSGDNSAASQSNYKSIVARSLGIDPNAALTPAQIPQLAAAMRQFETGSGGSGGQMRADMMTRAKQIASYDSAISAREKAGPRGNALMAMVQQINPQYDETQYGVRVASTKDFAVKNGNVVRSLNVAVQHLDTLQAASDALNNGNVPVLNAIAQRWAQATGSALPTNFNAVKDMVMGEVTKATIGSAGASGDRDKAQGILSNANSPAQLAGAIYQVKQLMGGQLKGLARQYEANTQRTDFASRYLDPHTAAVLGYGTGSGRGSPRVVQYDASGNRVS